MCVCWGWCRGGAICLHVFHAFLLNIVTDCCLHLQEAEASPLCRKLELKDIVPCQMQRLTKYPMLIENLMKYTSSMWLCLS